MPTMNANSATDRWALWLATGLGVGLVAPAPGTFGSLWGLPLAWAVGLLPGEGQQVFVILLLLGLGVIVCSIAAQALGGGKDPQPIVLDEITVVPIVLLGFYDRSFGVWIVGWLLFRAFDIIKPRPCHWLERLPRGWGIMADDVMAALYACATLHGLVWLDQATHLAWLTSPT